jgi:hypothetical protein
VSIPVKISKLEMGLGEERESTGEWDGWYDANDFGREVRGMLEQGVLGADDAERRANVKRMILSMLAKRAIQAKYGERFIGASRASSSSSTDGAPPDEDEEARDAPINRSPYLA